MFGMPPSVLMRGEFAEIASPFSTFRPGHFVPEFCALRIASLFNNNSCLIQSTSDTRAAILLLVDNHVDTFQRSFK